MKKILTLGLLAMLAGCENRDINEGEEFRPRAVKDSFEDTHFTKITVDGVEYIMTERDNNNPHEGFGFMAFRANKLMEKQDTILSYLRALQFFQNKIYTRMYSIPQDSGQAEFMRKLDEFLLLEGGELQQLQKEDLRNTDSVTGSGTEEE